MRPGFFARTVRTLHEDSREFFYAEHLSRRSGLLQAIDARAKVAGLFLLIVATSAASRAQTLSLLLAFSLLLAGLSRVPIRNILRSWAAAMLVTIALAISILPTPGGPERAGILVLRVLTASSFAALVILTTAWPKLLEALRAWRMPSVLVEVLSFTCRYVVLMLQTAREMFEARESRAVGRLGAAHQRRLAAAGIGVLLAKSSWFSDEVALAMQSRGYGSARILPRPTLAMPPTGWLALAVAAAVTGVTAWTG